MQKGTAPGPDRSPEPAVYNVEGLYPATMRRLPKKRRRPFFTKGSYFAMGILACGSALAWMGELRIAIWLYVVGALLFVLFCRPAVDVILTKLEDAMMAHHEKLPAVHGPWLKGFCPGCDAIHGD